MNRMSRYEEEVEEKELSRTAKNQDMYKDVYLNNTLIDVKDLLNEEKREEEKKEPVLVTYEEKSYDIEDYLEQARENRIDDNLKRSLTDVNCEVDKVKDKEDEISKLVESIEQKEKQGDLFSSLLPDDDSTVITDPIEDEKLEEVITEEVSYTYTETITDKYDFKGIEEKKDSRNNKLPLIVCLSSLFVLIIVIIVILLIK